MAKRINKAQINGVYWPAWRDAERVLIKIAGYSKAEAEEARKDIHRDVVGVACSSKDLTDRTLDEVLRKFAKISRPTDGAYQAEKARGPIIRLRFAINKLSKELGMSETAVESMAQRMCKRHFDHCDESQLTKIIQALKIHETRHTEKPASPQGQA